MFLYCFLYISEYSKIIIEIQSPVFPSMGVPLSVLAHLNEKIFMNY